MFERLKQLLGGVKKRPAANPEEDACLAEEAFKQNELKHAVFHIACALAHDPLRPEWRAFLERVSDVASEPLQLAPLEKENFYAVIAVRAYLLERLNRLPEALEILFQVVMTRPDVLYLAWAIEWLEKPEHRSRLPEDALLGFYLRLINELPRLQPPMGEGGVTLELVPRLIRITLRAEPKNTYLPFLGAGLLRRLGYREEALEVARRAHAVAPGYETVVAIASALQELGRTQESIAAFQEAERFKPEEPSVWLSMGDLYWEAGDLDAAARQYGRVLAVEPEHVWALPSLWVVEHERTGDDAWREKLEAYASAHPDNHRAASLMQRFLPYFGAYLPDPSEAIVNLARDVAQAIDRGDQIRLQDPFEITVNYLECPSAVLAVTRELPRLGLKVTPRLKVSKITTPDPRRPKGPVDHELWLYRGTDAEPAHPAPPEEVTEAIGAIARSPYSLDAWAERGREVGPALAAYHPDEILAVMVHPPDAPDGMRAWTWIYRLHVATALVIAGLSDGWQGTQRRKILLSLANGVVDWSVDAALLALATIAATDEVAEKEIGELYADLLRKSPREGYVCYLSPLAVCALQRLHLTPAERKQWQTLLDRL